MAERKMKKIEKNGKKWKKIKTEKKIKNKKKKKMCLEEKQTRLCGFDRHEISCQNETKFKMAN